jgi:L-aminopeptidase/D-esterase-like protein
LHPAIAPGPRNLITDIPGLSVGNAADAALKSGVTVLLGDAPMVAGVHVMGGAPGTRETDLLAPDKMVPGIDALVLSGGSAYGLEAAGGVMDGLRALGRGHAIGSAVVPIVPAAILFDLLNGGDKGWKANPYPALGRAALAAASAEFDLGTAGAGTGATVLGSRAVSARPRWCCRERRHRGRAGRGQRRRQRDLGDGPAFLGRTLRDRGRVRRPRPAHAPPSRLMPPTQARWRRRRPSASSRPTRC